MQRVHELHMTVATRCCCRCRSGVSLYAGGRPGEAPGGSAVGESRLEANPRRPRRPAESGPPCMARTTSPSAPSWLGGRGTEIGARRCDPPSSSPGRVGNRLSLCDGGRSLGGHSSLIATERGQCGEPSRGVNGGGGGGGWRPGLCGPA